MHSLIRPGRLIASLLRPRLAIAALAVLICGASSARAEIIFGLTVDNQILSFNSASPGTVSPLIGITGVGSDTIVGIDFRRSTGQLYAVGVGANNTARVYTINTSTGAVTSSVTLSTDAGDLSMPYTGAEGVSFGVDFNPQVVVGGVLQDRLRVISNTGQSLRINVATGATFTDTSLFDGGATPPSVTGVAYSNNDVDINTRTTLYGINTSDNTLVTVGGLNSIPSPNEGEVRTVGSLGLNVSSIAGFDISSSGVAFAALAPSGGGNTGLFTINLNTGAATSIGIINSGVTLRGIAVQSVPEPASLAMMGMGAVAVAGAIRRRRRATA